MSKLNKIRRAYIAGGLIVLLCHIVGYFWRQFIWLWLRMCTPNFLVERKIKGNRMFLSLRDFGISRELLVFGEHEPISTKILHEQLKKGMRVVDIGANIGYYVLQEACLVSNHGEVLAIEPVPDNFTLLKMNIGANSYQNIQSFQLAIGVENETRKMYLSRESNLCSLTQQIGIHDSFVDVPVMTLNSFLKRIGKMKVMRLR